MCGWVQWPALSSGNTFNGNCLWILFTFLNFLKYLFQSFFQLKLLHFGIDTSILVICNIVLSLHYNYFSPLYISLFSQYLCIVLWRDTISMNCVHIQFTRSSKSSNISLSLPPLLSKFNYRWNDPFLFSFWPHSSLLLLLLATHRKLFYYWAIFTFRHWINWMKEKKQMRSQ